jgi:NAD(P)-dependent dehydrogenase (short-subunit alcohol dehydrogenase family)
MVLDWLRQTPSLEGRRVFITGAARGIGAALAERLTERGAKVALAGLEEDFLAKTAEGLGAPWWLCDVTDRQRVEEVVEEAAKALGGLDVVVANAGIASQLPLVGGDPKLFEAVNSVNVLGVYYTLRAAGPHISHKNGYALAVSSLASAIHLPLMGAYSASKAAVEALGNTLRVELAPSGAKVGVAYFSVLNTDMTTRGFGTDAVRGVLGDGAVSRAAPLSEGIDALERGVARRSKRVVAPRWAKGVLAIRPLAQASVDGFLRSRLVRGRLRKAIDVAREEEVELTTEQAHFPEPRRED